MFKLTRFLKFARKLKSKMYFTILHLSKTSSISAITFHESAWCSVLIHHLLSLSSRSHNEIVARIISCNKTHPARNLQAACVCVCACVWYSLMLQCAAQWSKSIDYSVLVSRHVSISSLTYVSSSVHSTKLKQLIKFGFSVALKPITIFHWFLGFNYGPKMHLTGRRSFCQEAWKKFSVFANFALVWLKYGTIFSFYVKEVASTFLGLLLFCFLLLPY